MCCPTLIHFSSLRALRLSTLGYENVLTNVHAGTSILLKIAWLSIFEGHYVHRSSTSSPPQSEVPLSTKGFYLLCKADANKRQPKPASLVVHSL